MTGQKLEVAICVLVLYIQNVPLQSHFKIHIILVWLNPVHIQLYIILLYLKYVSTIPLHIATFY